MQVKSAMCCPAAEARRMMLFVAMLTACGTSVALAQSSDLEYFVAPTYPALARQAVVSGRVQFAVSIDILGKVVSATEDKSAHPLLVEKAKECVKEWRFRSGTRAREVTVTFYYGFSGLTDLTDPKARVTADFLSSGIRVFIVTDVPRNVSH